MKKTLIIFFLLICCVNIVFSQNFELWAERGGTFTIGKPEKVIIYIKNTGTTVETYGISFTKSASYKGVDVSNVISFTLISNKIANVKPGDTDSIMGNLIILGPADTGSITIKAIQQSDGKSKEYTLTNIRAFYPQSLDEFNFLYFFIFLLAVLFLKNKIKWVLPLLFSFYIVQAGYISITTTAEFPFISSNYTDGKIQIENSGDEIAKDVISVIDSKYFYSYVYMGDLPPGKRLIKNSTLIILEKLEPGKYIVPIKTYYKDLNGYSFSAITPLELVYETPTISKVHLSTKNLKITEGGKSKLEVKIKNNDSKDQKLHLILHLPDEIVADKSSIEINLPSNSEKTVFFYLSSFNAIKGSNYPFFVSVEYDDIYHYSSYSLSFIEIKPPIKIKPEYIFVGIVFMVSIFLFFNKKRKRKDNKFIL